jgi:pimeloyl-ACP methyl ester carboxylesterase
LSDSAFLRVQGRKIEYQFSLPTGGAAPCGPDIVMLHEGLGSVSMWKDFPRLLAESTHARVVAYSRFGYGRSDPPAQPHSALRMHEQEAFEVLPGVLDALEIGRPLLFGHSDGASIALMYAGAAPTQVAGVIALAPHVFVEEMCITGIESAKHTYLTTDLREKLARYHLDPDCAFWGWSNVWLDPAFRAWNIEHYLPRITCPVLAIQGYEDEYATMEQLERLARAVPNIELLKLVDCRHSPHRDQPAAVLEATQRFFASVPHL